MNMPDGTPVPVLLPEDPSAPVSSSNPNKRVRVTVTADASLLFGTALGLSSPKSVGRCRATGSEGQCATASAQGGSYTQPSYPTRLFAFAMGDHDSSRCEFGIDIRGPRNKWEGE